MSRTLACLLLAAALLAGTSSCRAWDILDPSDVIQELTQGSGSAGLEKWKKPDFCGKSDCPPYRVKKHTDNYEIRKYEAGKWLVTNVTGSKFELAYTRATSKLQKYFKGENDKKEKMELTTPTLAELKLDKEGQSSDKDYHFSYWLPEDMQKDTPQPTDADLKVIDYPSITVYVRVFSGFATEGTILKEAHGLHEMLDDDDRDFDDQVVWAAVYDPPQKLLNRHNEIHVPYSSKKKRGQGAGKEEVAKS